MKPVRLLLSCFIYVKKLYDSVDYIPFFPSWYRFLSTSVVYFYSMMPEKRIFRVEGPSPATAAGAIVRHIHFFIDIGEKENGEGQSGLKPDSPRKGIQNNRPSRS